MWKAARAGLALGCSIGVASAPASADVASRAQPILYGQDDRAELLAAPLDWVRNAGTESLVALGWASSLSRPDEEGHIVTVCPSWEEYAGLCPGQRFGEQPAFALCTGIALTTDLVLTAGHCAELANDAAEDGAVALSGFFYGPEGGDPLLEGSDVHPVLEVVARDSYLDVALLRVTPGLEPLRLSPALEARAGMPVVAINHGGGVPAKFDAGGAIRLDEAEWLVANVDAFGGASGGPVFTLDGDFLGILTAGRDDYVPEPSGCLVADQLADDEAQELVVKFDEMKRMLCDAAPDQPPCRSSTSDGALASTSGCTLPRGRAPSSAPLALLLGVWLLRRWTNRRRRVYGAPPRDAFGRGKLEASIDDSPTTVARVPGSLLSRHARVR